MSRQQITIIAQHDLFPLGPWTFTDSLAAYGVIEHLKNRGSTNIRVSRRLGRRRWYAPWLTKWGEWEVLR